jgi:hypothetical protein
LTKHKKIADQRSTVPVLILAVSEQYVFRV